MRDLSSLADEDLLCLSSGGDEEAFTALYRRRQGRLYRFTLQMTGEAALAEEVVQEVFLEVIRARGRFDAARGSVASWMFGIARNLVLRRLEQEGKYAHVEESDETGIETAESSPLEDLTRAEGLKNLRQAVLALPPAYRETVVLCDLQELSYDDAAAALGCPVGTIRSRLNRGRAMLAERLRAKAVRQS
ncbi:MAG: RNA polymerase sigma factor [Bryobacteraceae bacterium]